MPAERTKRQTTPTKVPQLGDPERKRVLNVLAQRRYRERQRERLISLQRRADTSESNTTPPSSLRNQQDALLLHPEGEVFNSTPESSPADEETMNVDSNLLTFDFVSNEFNFDSMQSFCNLSTLPDPIPSVSFHSPPLFPLALDGAMMPLPILNTLRACSNVALAFSITAHIWDPSYLHVLPTSMSPSAASLPTNLHPTPAQCTVPHHPVLDLLPWPSVRDKLICMLSMPSVFRPPVAQEENGDEQLSPLSTESLPGSVQYAKQSTAVMRLVQDLDDLQDGGGVRVHGNMTTWNEGNELAEEAWEIGDIFYKRWWWCLDQKIVETSNRWRRERGLPRLKLIA